MVLASALVLAVASAQQWSPYQQQYNQHMAYEPNSYYGVPSNYGQEAMQDQQFQASDYSNYDFGGGGGGGGGHDSGDEGHGGHAQSFDHGGHELQHQAYPVHQHVEEENPEPIKHYKEVLVPLPKNVEFKVHHPIIIPVPHPVPIQIPVPKAVVIPIIKEVSVPVEKSVPYPVEKIVHVPKIKEVPFEVVKHIIVPVEKPIPFKVPVYETIIHTKKGSHKI